jgi:poly(3-hydroxybutyrate) depolymerase
MEELGKIYIPNTCSQGNQCHVHFVLHGNGSRDFEADRNSRYNNIAAQNNIIMVYPRFEPGFGHNLIRDESNRTRNGIFPRVIMGMIDILKNGSCLQ